MRINALTAATIIGLFLFCSCNPKISTPAFIYVDSVSFSCGDEYGSASHSIKDIRLTVNGDDRGSYSLPALIPVTTTGNVKVEIQPVVLRNGLPQQRMVNYTYSLFSQTRTLTANKIDTIRPHFTYSTSVTVPFLFIEDFEDAGLKFQSNGAELQKTNDTGLVFQYLNETNHYSGIITIAPTDTARNFEITTVTPINMSSASATVCFLELNCSSTQSLEVGIYYYTASTSVSQQEIIANINATSDRKTWRKLYINITEILNNNPDIYSYDLYIKGYAGGVTASDTFLFDNIKLVKI